MGHTPDCAEFGSGLGGLTSIESSEYYDRVLTVLLLKGKSGFLALLY
jgi:hypothetical protein